MLLAPSTGSTVSEGEYLHIVSELNDERLRRSATEDELVSVKAELATTKSHLESALFKLAEAEKRLLLPRDKSAFAADMWSAAQEMSPGQAFIATVAAPVMTAPLAAATVVKSIHRVGAGIATLFHKSEVPPAPAASNTPTKTSTSDPPNPTPS